LRVNDDGSTSHLATVALRSAEWAKLLGLFGVSLAGAAWVAGVVWVMSTGTFANAMLVLFCAGMALGVVAAVGYWLGSDDWLSHIGSGWHQPTNLHGWMPRTSAQLAAAESIADRHDGRALVRDVGAATIDVCAENWGGLDHYIVDDDGFTMKQIGQTPIGFARPPNLLVSSPLRLALLFGLPLVGAGIGGLLAAGWNADRGRHRSLDMASVADAATRTQQRRHKVDRDPDPGGRGRLRRGQGARAASKSRWSTGR
jgi:hypothetical protein